MARNVTGTETFTNGPYVIPTNGDRGEAEVFDVLELVLERLATHSHTGADSQDISLNIQKDQEVFRLGLNLSWTGVGNDTFRALIPVPVSTTYDNSIRKYFIDTPSGFEEFYPKVEKVDDNNYYLYSNDNTIEIKVVTL